ncbi:MAG: cyanophycinase [Actinomycetes bacterium]
MPSRPAADDARGYLIPIGGAEDHRHKVILERFVDLCGGEDAVIAILPTASRMKDTGSRYVEAFDDLGVADAVSLPIRVRSDARDERYVAELERATGIFITGGDQLRLATVIGGTPVAQAIRRRHAEGVHVAGTSAGAAIQPEHMIAGGEAGPTPEAELVTLAPGLGLTNKVVVDQHFRQRDRLGRLLTAVSFNPFLVGLGIDEDTAAFIGPDDVLEVVGSGAVTIVDPAELDHSSMAAARGTDPVSLIDLRLHVLVAGGRYDLTTRTASL